MSSPSYPALKALDEFLEKTFDYLIVGGGTAGLAVAARLSEDPNITVGVLEAGPARLGDPSILTPAAFSQVIGNGDYDWMMKTAGTNNLSHAFTRGKVLGGSSAINLMMYIRGQASEYDDWAKITGYSTWGWKGLKPFFLKHEGMIEPPQLAQQTDASNAANGNHSSYEKEHHGVSGPIKTSFPDWSPPIEEDWHQASKNAGLAWMPPTDAWSGNLLGGFTNLSTIDRSNGSGTRSYAVTGYFIPNAGRQNLLVLTEAYVEKVILETNGQGIEAKGVRFIKDGKRYTVSSKQEVILSAGTVQTPQILEMSGIGTSSLPPHSISCQMATSLRHEHLSLRL